MRTPTVVPAAPAPVAPLPDRVTSSALTSVGTRAASFWRPSRAPTS